ncbi:MAG TPA: AAA family ATPase, partial [Thermoanaerobaculia bacterium]
MTERRSPGPRRARPARHPRAAGLPPSPPPRAGAALPFVGREQETAALAAALAAGLNVVVEGKYGMGRTALLRQVEAALGRAYRFAFADGDLTPAAICEQWLAALAGAKRRRPERYLAVRAALLRVPLADPRPHVLVLDNLCRLTPPKADLIRRLASCGRFRLAAIL